MRRAGQLLADDPVQLLQFLHQIVFRVEAAGGVDEQIIRLARLRGGHSVMRHGRRVRAVSAGDDFHLEFLAPEFDLFDGRSAEGVAGGEQRRFIKIGGEMVGLTGLEEEIQRIFIEKGWKKGDSKAPFLALVVREKDSEKSEIILFTKFSVDKEEVNLALKQSGHGRIIKIAEVRAIDEIPVTGTGKVHYRVLEEKLQS